MTAGINWLEWNSGSFEKARKEDKPILLDLTAVWCHWCHVMDSTTYSDEGVADLVNRDFVPIKVYIDKRPDIRDRYNMGGFPSTVFLSPDGDVLAGDTYVATERFKLMLESIKKSYIKSRDKAWQKFPEKITGGKEGKENKESKIEEAMIKEILLSIEGSFDSFYGGFGVQPKFPPADVVDLLLMQYQKTRDKKYLGMAIKTLDGMHEGIYDKIDFGFFRYSVTQDWKNPHYEKLLDTNAGMLRNYAAAFSITKDEKYRRLAEETIEYVNRLLSNQNGGFYGSQDADEEFYRSKLEERKRMRQPYVDRTIYSDWNGMMISAYIRSGAILNNHNAVEFAIKSADFILENCYGNKTGVFHYFDGKPNVSGLLGDNVYFLNSLIDVYFISQNPKYLEKITEIADFIMEKFYDKKTGGFFDKAENAEDFGALKYGNKQFLENSLCAIVFLRLYFLAKEEKYRDASEKTLLYFSSGYLNFGYFAAMYAIAAEMLLSGGIKVDVVGRKDMVNTCAASANPRVTVKLTNKDDEKNPGYETEGAYVCKGAVCKGPIKDNIKLEQELFG